LRGPAGVTALVLGELAAGGVALLFLTPLWHEVKPGFFKLTGSVILVAAVGAWGSASAGLMEGSQAGQWSERLAGALAAVTLVWVTLLFVRRPGPARAVGVASVPLSMVMLGAMAGTADASPVVSFLQLLAGAAFLGAVVDGLLLGHWYLTDRGLSRGPINRSTSFLIIAVLLEASAVVAGGFGPTRATSNFNPLLTSAGLASWIALGMVGATALIAIVIRAALKAPRASAVQAATGFFYLAVITAFTAEFAAKVRFFR
jgi:hypothetical protein